MILHEIKIPDEEIAAFCRRNRVRRLALFGSILREDFRPESDIDMLVEFEAGQPAGLLRLAELELELADLIGRRVDLSMSDCLNPYFRQEVMQEARNLYVAA